MAQQLGTLAADSEKWGSLPSTYMELQYDGIWQILPIYIGTNIFICMWNKHIHRNKTIHRHKLKINIAKLNVYMKNHTLLLVVVLLGLYICKIKILGTHIYTCILYLILWGMFCPKV